MKKLFFTMLMAVSISAVSAQDKTYRDDNGDYHYETKDQQVWIPEQRTAGIFGVGGRTIPGHYETRRDQLKVYHNDYQTTGQNGWQGKHPHGMPPGQRKKLQNNTNRNWSDQDNWNDHKTKGGKKNK